jgi:hypothetical protein
MGVDDQLAQCTAANGESLGPVYRLMGELLSRVGAAVGSVAEWLRQAAIEQPLTTLLLSFQAGFVKRLQLSGSRGN